MITAEFKFHANFIKSNPLGSVEDMQIESVWMTLRKVEVDDGADEAELGPFGTEQLVEIEPGIYGKTLSLETNSHYLIELTAKNPAGNIRCKKIFINTADATKYYFLEYKINTKIGEGGLETIIPVEGAVFKLTPPSGMEFPKWVDGITDTANPTGYSYPDSPTATELYNYIKDVLEFSANPGLHIKAVSGYAGLLTLQRLPAGTYGYEITKSGYVTKSGTISVSKDDSGEWIINKETS